VITLSLLHPIKQTPVQVWTFENESVIRIGRSTDNHVILYSAVVSRHHVELRRVGADWEIVNLGTNGTYLDGKRIDQVTVNDGAVFRLARSGPNVRIRLNSEIETNLPTDVEKASLSRSPDPSRFPTEVTDRRSPPPSGESAPPDALDAELLRMHQGVIPVPPHLRLDDTEAEGLHHVSTLPQLSSSQAVNCRHERGGDVFCVECGQPIHSLGQVGGYQLLQALGTSRVGTTYQAWQGGDLVVVKTLNPPWRDRPEAQAALEFEADTLRQLSHSQVPRLIDFFFEQAVPYLVMELMRGQDLASYIRVLGAVSIERAIAWIMETCTLLDYLHRFMPPILHRNLQPEHLIYQPDAPPHQTLSLVGFGAMKQVVLEPSSGKPPLGSERDVAYDAPEVLSLEATPAADLYAIAPLFTFLVTGQNPVYFYGDRGDGNRFWAERVPSLHPQLMAILDKLTDPRPAARYQSARAVAAAFQYFAEG
jgi:serine/threonine-protein kinase